MTDASYPEFWRKIKPGSTLTLSDRLTLETSMQRGEGVLAQDYVIEQVLTIRQRDDFAEWLLFKLRDDTDILHFLVKIVDEELDLRVYFEPGDDIFDAGNRRDLIDRGEYWLFQEPRDSEKFSYDELMFTEVFTWTVENDSGEETDIEYELKPQGLQYGVGAYLPAQSGMSELFASILEYRAIQESDYPEALVLELGGEESDEGGWITLFFGYSIRPTEVDVLAV